MDLRRLPHSAWSRSKLAGPSVVVHHVGRRLRRRGALTHSVAARDRGSAASRGGLVGAHATTLARVKGGVEDRVSIW